MHLEEEKVQHPPEHQAAAGVWLGALLHHFCAWTAAAATWPCKLPSAWLLPGCGLQHLPDNPADATLADPALKTGCCQTDQYCTSILTALLMQHWLTLHSTKGHAAVGCDNSNNNHDKRQGWRGRRPLLLLATLPSAWLQACCKFQQHPDILLHTHLALAGMRFVCYC